MHLGQAMPMVGAGQREESFKLFSQHLDREWIARALQATGTATVRRRKLPAEYVVWIVVGMGLLLDRSIQEVVRHLDLVLPDVEAPTLRVANTEENEAAFGRPGSSRGRAGYSQVCLVGLMVLRSHLLAGLVVGRCTDAE